MDPWTAYPYDPAEYALTGEALRMRWGRLHQGDAEPLPPAEAVLDAWALFHAGRYEAAFEAGLAAGSAGVTVANKAQAIHANYLERREKTRHAMLLQVAERAAALQRIEPTNANAFYWQAYAIGRYSQGISVAKALAQGLGGQVKVALEATIALAPRHADAHIALGAFHAEVIDKVGRGLGRTQGADAATGLKMYREALKLNPTSAIARVEYAQGLLMLEGPRKMREAETLYAEATACVPMDATERLHVEIARSGL